MPRGARGIAVAAGDSVGADAVDEGVGVGEGEFVLVPLQAPMSSAVMDAIAARATRRRERDEWEVVMSRL